ncbi:hypothetical protein OG235_36670 [Streptomyces sp. NBC_00024]|uniref:hypothetical protein n=1 Tax=Streptomyces sp. NBC_00024 TaxID=2903612 RepID=UPI0032546C40
MGRSSNAVLVYGYDLGGPDEWKLRSLGQYGELPSLDWYDDEDDDGDDSLDFATAAQDRLRAAVAGFTEEWTPDARETGYYDRRRAAEQSVGVKVETYCSHSAPMFALAAHVTTVHRGHVDYIDPQDLLDRPSTEDWDSRLIVAVEALDLVPVQEHPRWFLVSYGDL